MTLIRITRWRLKPSKDGWMDVYTKGRWKFVLKFQDLVLTMTHLMVMIVTIIWSWIWRKLEISLKLWNQRFFLLQNFVWYEYIFKWTLLEIYFRPERRFLAFVIMSLWSLCCIISWIINDLIKHKQYLVLSCVLCAAVYSDYLVATAVYGSSW